MTLHDDRWRDHAACRGLDVRAWFPERGVEGPDLDPYTICAGCPVIVDCLVWAVDSHQGDGIHGGAGGGAKRLLWRAYKLRTHNGYMGKHNHGTCTCGWCTEVDRHIDRLRHATHRIESNGPHARHGYRSTYARGHRCARCKFSVTTVGSAMRDAGLDLPDWWDATFGAGHGYSSYPPTVARQLRAAKDAGQAWLARKGHAA